MALQSVSQLLYEQASQQQAANADGGTDGGAAPNDDEVVDAEIVDEKGA